MSSCPVPLVQALLHTRKKNVTPIPPPDTRARFTPSFLESFRFPLYLEDRFLIYSFSDWFIYWSSALYHLHDSRNIWTVLIHSFIKWGRNGGRNGRNGGRKKLKGRKEKKGDRECEGSDCPIAQTKYMSHKVPRPIACLPPHMALFALFTHLHMSTHVNWMVYMITAKHSHFMTTNTATLQYCTHPLNNAKDRLLHSGLW